MSLFFETIKLQNGIPKNLSYHQARVDRTYAHYWGAEPKLHLAETLHRSTRQTEAVLAKCKIIYDIQGILSITETEYLVRATDALQIIDIQAHENYPYKSLDRRWIEAYVQKLPARTDALFVRDGLVLESSYTNVALLQEGRWYTPSHPLHRGTTLQRFTESGHLIPREIPVHTLKDFEELRLFNAILGWGLGFRFSYSQLVF